MNYRKKKLLALDPMHDSSVSSFIGLMSIQFFESGRLLPVPVVPLAVLSHKILDEQNATTPRQKQWNCHFSYLCLVIFLVFCWVTRKMWLLICWQTRRFIISWFVLKMCRYIDAQLYCVSDYFKNLFWLLDWIFLNLVIFVTLDYSFTEIISRVTVILPAARIFTNHWSTIVIKL